MNEPQNTRRATFKAAAETTTIYVYGDIGDKWEGIDAKLFVEDLRNVRTPQIDLHFHSYGGDAFEAYAMHSQLRIHPARKVGHVDSIAASAAAHMLFACDEIQMAENSVVVIHNPWSGSIVMGDYRDYTAAIEGELVGDRDRLLEMRDQIAATVAKRATELGEDVVKEMMDAETWIYPEAAKAMGLADEISPELNVAAKINADTLKTRFRNVPDAVFGSIEAAADIGTGEPVVPDEPAESLWRFNWAERQLALSRQKRGLTTAPE